MWKILELEPSLSNLRSLLEIEKLFPCQCPYGQMENIENSMNKQCVLSSGCMQSINKERGMWSHGCMPLNLICHRKMVNTENYLPYSRGGSGGSSGLSEEDRLVLQDEQAQLMYTTAISIAASFDCHLKPGVSTRGLGDCLIEACIDQFVQDCFEDLTENEKEPMYWRLRLADVLENNITAYKMYNIVKSKQARTKQQQWMHDWATLRKSGEFQCQAGDLMAPGLAMILHKNILVFNTCPNANSPITLHLAETLGGSTTTSIPILLCYDGMHYEGLLPVSDEDQNKTIELVRRYSPKRKTVSLSVICPIPGMNIEQKKE